VRRLGQERNCKVVDAITAKGPLVFMLASSPMKRICMISHSFYESDNRVMRYAESLAKRGDDVEVFALRRSPESPREETLNGVRIYRIQNRFDKRQQSVFSYLLPVLRFLLASAWWTTKRHLRRHYDLVHVHNLPDFIVFAALLPKLTGAKVILDVHDIVPEFFASKFGAADNAIFVRSLRLVEKVSARCADHVILSNHLWLERYSARSAPRSKCSVFINYVDTSIFRPRHEPKSGNDVVILFPGGLQWHQGLDIAIRAVDILRRRLPQVVLHIYGEGSAEPALISLARELQMDEVVRFFRPLRIHDIAEVMARADLGVVPKRSDSFGNEAYSTKIMEFMSVGVPVVVSSTKIDRYYFDEAVVRFFRSGDAVDLANAMLEVLTENEERAQMVERAKEFACRNSWQTRQADYLALVDRLIARD
jgi:glycosyltransferase involved in cell wall biosynthesis